MNTTAKIQQAMSEFIEERLADKLDNEKHEGKRQALREKYQPAAWIADAARRVKQIQLVTHALKYSHPDARGSNLCSDGFVVIDEALVGTHTLREQKSLDVVGNAASLDVYKFLSLEVGGVPLWQLAHNQDPSLFAALPGNLEEKKSWIDSFASLARNDQKPRSHPLAKQVYWPLGNDDYHLLQPLFPTSLVQRVHDLLREARFSDEAKAAREARRNGKSHAHGYSDWPALLILRFGGTKPQNISQLNSQRHGEAWLMPSVPPQWEPRGLRPPLSLDTVFKRLPRNFNRKVEELGRYLASVREWNNKGIRDGRGRRVSEIIDELIEYAIKIQSLDAGWSANGNCKLSDAERYWLDPGRDDGDFQQKRSSTDWPRDIAERFGRWLNTRLHRHKLPMGDPEHHVWQREFETELADHLREIKNA